MTHSLDTYTRSSAKEFLEEIYKALEDQSINVNELLLDHICYRVDTMGKYNFLKNVLLRKNTLIIESEINSRPISNFKLSEPIKFGKQEISVFELPAPKSGSYYPEGYEHVEFVVPFPVKEMLKMYPDVNFDQSGLNKYINRNVRLKLGNLSVKFHEQSLEEVIKFENDI